MTKRFVPMLAAGLLGVSLTLFADAKTGYRHSTDFRTYHTYSWLKVQAGNQLWQDRIKTAVDNFLLAKGWTQAASGVEAGIAAFGSTQR